MNTQRVIYAGRRRGAKRPIIHVYVPEANEGEDGAFVFSKPLVSGLAVGYILEVSHPNDAPDSVYTAGEHAPRTVGYAEGDARILAWQVEDRATYQVKAEADAAKRQEARSQDQSMEHHVAALAQAAEGLGWVAREAFINFVANRIRSGR